jgi:hypothetical protein
MPFPKADFCVVCDGLRPELGGKATVLGFYGVAPNVELLAPSLGISTPVCLVVGIPAPPKGTEREYQQSLSIIAPSGKVVLQTPSTPATIQPGTRAILAFQIAFAPTESGDHAIRVKIGDAVALETHITIRVATAEETKAAGYYV